MAYEANGCLGSGRVQTEIEISPGPLLRRTLLEHIKNSSDHFRFDPNRTLNLIRAAET
jgi:hypothetical protein